MDQSAFRNLLQGQGPSSASTSRARPIGSHGAIGGGRQRLGVGASSARLDQGIPSALSSKSSVEQFRPRQQKPLPDKGKAKAVDQDTPVEPTFKKYGYADRASKRRAGLNDGEDSEAQEERRPRGLDFSKLDPNKRALLGIELEELPIEEPRENPLSIKTDEEIEAELAEAEAKLQAEREPPTEAVGLGKDDQADGLKPVAKKQKRSRADMLRDLQAKIAAASSAATEVKLMEPTANTGRKEKKTTAAPEPPVMKGFKAIERAPEKKKKKKRAEVDSVVENSLSASAQDANVGPATGSTVADDETQGSTMTGNDDDDDIFGGAGDYDDGLSADEVSAEEGEEREAASKPDGEDARPFKYFEDQDDIIPKFETWRTPTPPPRQQGDSPRHRQSGSEEADRQHKPQRLEGLSTSHYSARDLLERDNALAREEKRKLRKLKGKDKKEALERLAELDGSRTAEQKEADRLNRDAQEYENYERKKQKRERPETS